MSLSTFSIFYYDFTITDDNRFLSFNEGTGELIAEIETGNWTATELATQIKTAMDFVAANNYTVVFNRNTQTFTISTTVNFSLLIAGGTSGSSVFTTIGFTGADRTGLTAHTSNAKAGQEFEPQFILQDYVPETNFQKLVSPSVNKTANGRVEVIRFGTEKFIQANIKFITNNPADGKVIKSNPTGLEDANRFLQFATQKKPMEFMSNINDRALFLKVILESTVGNGDGTGYQLKELYDRGLPGVFETGIFTMRVLEF